MNNISGYFSKNYWRYNISIIKAAKSFFEAFGGLWLIVEVTSYFSSNLSNIMKGNWMLFLLVGLMWSLWENRPILSINQKLNDRDVIIEICVSDFFSFDGAYIIGSNTTFDTEISNGLISPRSIQGQFTQQYYDNTRYLDNDLDEALKNVTITETNSNKIGKNKVYEIGTVAKITKNNKDAYFVAMASINEHGNAYSTFENLQNSLVKLWDFIGYRGGIEPLAIPLLGTGFSRIEVPREKIIKEIIKSFIAACATKRFSEKLSIVIHPKDYQRYDLNLVDLNDFLKYECKYVQFKNNRDSGGGVGIAYKEAI
jgi:hypothetical protein